MTQEGQITEEDQKTQARIGDLLQKDHLTAKEQQELAETTDPTEMLKENGLYSNGEEPPGEDFIEEQNRRLQPSTAGGQPNESNTKPRGKTVQQEELLAVRGPVLAANSPDKDEDTQITADEPEKPTTDPESTSDARIKAAPAKKTTAKKAAKK